MIDWAKGFLVKSDGTIHGTVVTDQEGLVVPKIRKLTISLDAEKLYPEVTVEYGGGTQYAGSEVSGIAYILDDAQLEQCIKTGKYNGEHSLQVYVEKFICNERKTILNDGPITGRGMSDYPAKARKFSWWNGDGDSHESINYYLTGNYHFAWFVEGILKWVVKYFVVLGYSLREKCGTATLEDSEFIGGKLFSFYTVKIGNEENVTKKIPREKTEKSWTVDCKFLKKVSEKACKVDHVDLAQCEAVVLALHYLGYLAIEEENER